MVAFNKFNSASENLLKSINIGTDVFKLLFTNTAPVATNSVKADITEITAGNGYTAGGPTLTITSSVQTSGTTKLVADDVTVTASGGSIGPFRYVVLYSDTPTSPAKPLIAWWDKGTNITVLDGDNFKFDANQINGLFQVT